MMKQTAILIITISTLLALTSCNEQVATKNERMPLVSVKTTLVQQGEIEDNIILNGKTIYLKKNPVVSPIAGYVVNAQVKYGDEVKRDDVLFEVQTKEGKALENSNISGSNIGIVKVLAPSNGFINELNINETGGYVVEGSLLCSIVENKDLVIQVNVPFEYNSLIKTGTMCTLFLADDSKFSGSVFRLLPVINEVNQTQNVLIKPNTTRQLPENLNLRVQFINTKHSNSFLLPKEAVMTNETQSEFWVMKIMNDSIAIKVPVVKGIQNDSVVEILSPDLNKNDMVIREGAYGLPDSTVVKIVK